MSTDPNGAPARRRKILFTDWRDVDCGSVAWLTAEGERYRVGNPPGEPVAMRAEQPSVPRGTRQERLLGIDRDLATVAATRCRSRGPIGGHSASMTFGAWRRNDCLR